MKEASCYACISSGGTFPLLRVIVLLPSFQVIDLSKITMFVLDEADVMIDQQGQQDQTIRIQK